MKLIMAFGKKVVNSKLMLLTAYKIATIQVKNKYLKSNF